MANNEYIFSLLENAALVEIGERLTQRRIQLDLTQAELAKRAGVGKRTLERLEAGGSTQMSNFLRVLRELALLEDLVAAIPDARPSPMDLLRSKGKERKRVRHKKSDQNILREQPSKWTWGE